MVHFSTSHVFSFNQAIKFWRFVTFHIFIFTSTSLYFKCLNYVYQICLADLSFQHRPQNTKNVRCIAKTRCCLDSVSYRTELTHVAAYLILKNTSLKSNDIYLKGGKDITSQTTFSHQNIVPRHSHPHDNYTSCTLLLYLDYIDMRTI